MNLRKLATFVVVLLTTGVAFPVYAIVDFGASTALDSIQTDQGTFFGFGQTGNIEDIGFYYKPGASHNICSVKFLLTTNNGLVTDALKLDLRIGTTTSGHLYNAGTLVATADSHIQVRSTSPTVTEFTFTPCATVVGSHDYFFALYRDGALSATNYYRIYVETSPPPTYYGTAAKNIFLVYNTALTKTNCGLGNCADIVINGTENFGATVPSTTPSFAQSVIDQITGINDNNATSTITGNVGGWANIPAFFAKKVPWGYAFDIAEVYDNLSTSTSEFSAIVFDFTDTRISTGTRSWLPGRITVFSTSTVTYYLTTNTLNALNTLAAAIGWMLAAYYWFRRAVKT